MFRGFLSVAVLIALPAAALAQQPCTTDARHVVDELYRHMLERPADAGSAGWVGALQNGSASVRDIVREIAKSPEHAQRFYNPGEGAPANERAVGILYRHILGRQPDAAGLTGFANIAATSGIGAVVDAIMRSSEYSQTFGDWSVPGSGGVRYCGNGTTPQAASVSAAAPEMRFTALDLNHNGVIARNEWRGSANAFRIHDWNGDGVLSGEEVRVGATPPPGALEARDYSMTTNDRFEYLDVNGNGVVDQNEWDGSLDTFYRLDVNNDGRLSRPELGSARGSSFAAIDMSRDGRITLNEWPWSHRTFDDQDVNGDGVIAPDEFRGGAVSTTGR